MPSDRLESMLDELDTAPESPPPARFLGAVRARRRRRTAAQAAYAAGLTLAGAALTVVFVRPPEPIADAPIAAAPPPDSIFRLRNATVLPEPAHDSPAEIITIGHRPDPEEVAAWVSGS